MKIAPVVFCAALAIFLTTIAVSKQVSVRIVDTKQMLDFSGIDTLEIKSKASASIHITDSATSSVAFDSNSEYYQQNQHAIISVVKTGNKMTIMTNIETYRELHLVIPTVVTSLIVNDADIDAVDSPETINVQVSNSLAWQGDEKNMRITDYRDYSNPKATCVSDIVISKGAIGNLFVETKRGRIKLKALDQIQSTTLRVGRDASLLLSPIASMNAVHLQDFPEAVVPAEGVVKKALEQQEYGCPDY